MEIFEREIDGMNSIMLEAQKGLTPEIEYIAEKEHLDKEKICRLIVNGRIVIPRNYVHSPIPCGIGEGLRVKVNASVGTSPDYQDLKEEIKKAKIAVQFGADSIMDLSISGKLDYIRKELLKNTKVPFGTVPIYQAAIDSGRRILNMSESDIFNTIKRHIESGVDFITVHCGLRKEHLYYLEKQKRLIKMVSRGGSFIGAWMLHNDSENPLYENFDYLLELVKPYDVILSLADALRPGAVADALDIPQIQELMTQGELVRRARRANVQTMVEGPGHMPAHLIESYVRLAKTICDGAPLFVMGPLVTDFAPGYDHIVSAIGGTIAGMYGADFNCYVTPAEHLCLPTVEDIKEGVVAAKIAAHAADLTKGKDWDIDTGIAKAREELDWDGQFNRAIDPRKPRRYMRQRKSKCTRVCSMCGELCSMKIVRDLWKVRE